jgi:hypothetical protein
MKSKTSPSETRDSAVKALLARHVTACEMTMPIDRDRITDRLQAWLSGISTQKLQLRFLNRADEIGSVGKLAWDAWDAWDASAASAAWAARDAWDAWAARDAWDAWDASAASAAWAARDAWDAWAAWIYNWDCSWVSIIAIGALSRADEPTFKLWLPILEAFEAGAWLFWITKEEIVVAERPQVVLVNDKRQLHCSDRPAFVWLEIREFYINGVRQSQPPK